MSGKRHHYIPRFLQSGFASHTNGDEVFTWVYRKGSKVFNTNIVNVGIEGLFYSLNGDNQVDDDITRAEERYSSLIQALRNGTIDAASNTNAIAELLAHLEIRTRHFRENFSNMTSVLVEELLRFVEDEQAFGAYIQRKIRNDPSILRHIIAEELKTINLPVSMHEQALNVSQPLIEQLLPSLLGNLPQIANHFRAGIPQIIKENAKSGHIKGLQQALAPSVKAEVYANLKFRVLHVQNAMIPLGDSMLVFHLDGDRAFKPFSEKDDQIRSVYLPLSPDCVLVGSSNDTVLDISRLPTVIAQCSLEYFIGINKSAENDRLHGCIGESAYILSPNEIEAIIEELKNG